MDKAPIIGISRHRLGSDGRGIRTLVAFHGCPLSCLYCLNPSCLSPKSDSQLISVDDIVKILHKDALYFLATQGGVTFGGGEPFLRYDFIRKVIEKNAEKLDVTLETSLNVPRKNIEAVLPYIREFIVDIKDMDDTILASVWTTTGALPRGCFLVKLPLVGNLGKLATPVVFQSQVPADSYCC